MIWRALVFCILTFQLFGITEAQDELGRRQVIDLPQGDVTRIPSPDRKWTLVFECPNHCAERRLWIEDGKSHTRRLVGEYERDLSVSWAPNSKSFFVDDEYGSNGTLAYIYDADNLKKTELAMLLEAADPKTTGLLKAGHSYLKAKRWLSSQDLLVILYGHFDEHHPRAFTVLYRVDRDGRVVKLSESSEEKP